VRNVRVIGHVAFEDLGSFSHVLKEKGCVLETLQAGVDGLGSPLDPDLLVVLGGPIGVYEEDRYPFLRHEIGFIRKRLEAGRPTLGVCLGAQLMAAALGAAVYPGPAKEIGWKKLTLTDAGKQSCLAPLEDVAVLHWHGDTFDLPEGAELLASTDICKHQAFSLGNFGLALQFHPEAKARDMERWLIGHTCELGAAGIDIPALRADSAAKAPVLEQAGAEVLRRWLKALAG
jgi:GMP synthase (glutamine-hydrolysing)